ncbi:uncharacterized protein VTP21DRAFT_9334 [Calcarisporiella thermophila]|uniref:uncharacterized protein n=1 Tax=Calcarisporiella thermophila TaxID=911321 RepID=UPI0037421256
MVGVNKGVIEAYAQTPKESGEALLGLVSEPQSMGESNGPSAPGQCAEGVYISAKLVRRWNSPENAHGLYSHCLVDFRSVPLGGSQAIDVLALPNKKAALPVAILPDQAGRGTNPRGVSISNLSVSDHAYEPRADRGLGGSSSVAFGSLWPKLTAL